MKKTVLFNFVLLLVFGLSSCIDEATNELNIEDEGSFLINQCEGFGIYSNQQYDCGWKRGYDDYVFQYNHIVNRESYGKCFEIVSWNGQSLTSDKVSSGYFIPQKVWNEFAQYRSYITQQQSNNSFAQGKFDGWMSASGQEVLSTGACGDGTPDQPFN